MRKLRAFLVDDEPLALRRLAVTLDAIDDVEVVGSSTSARGSIGEIAKLKPDVLFLDISMPSLDGFDLVEKLGAQDVPEVVFVTAYDEHAVRAFGISAVDYLLKPFAPERLKRAVERVRAAVAARGDRERIERLEAIVATVDEAEKEEAPADAYEDSLWVHRNRELVRVPIPSVEWIEAERDYVRLHSAEGGGLLRTTLSALEAKLDPAIFIRIHRSAICRRDSISTLRRKRSGALTVSLTSGAEVPVGRSYVKGLRELLSQIRG